MAVTEPAKSRLVAACPRCSARYRVLADRLPSRGARLRCALCRAGFRVRLPKPAPAVAPAVLGRATAGLPSNNGREPASLHALPDPEEAPPKAETLTSSLQERARGGAEAAQRLARIVASELLLYHPERFDAGIQSGDVLAAMAPEIEEGRAMLAPRMTAGGDARQLLEQEILRVAAERSASPAD